MKIFPPDEQKRHGDTMAAHIQSALSALFPDQDGDFDFVLVTTVHKDHASGRATTMIVYSSLTGLSLIQRAEEMLRDMSQTPTTSAN